MLEAPLLEASPLRIGKRQTKDAPAALAYIACFTLTIALGLPAYLNVGRLGPAPQPCVRPAPTADDAGASTDDASSVAPPGWTGGLMRRLPLFACACAGIALAATAWLHVLRAHARTVVLGTASLVPVGYMCMSVALLAAGASLGALGAVAAALASALLLWLFRARLQLTVALIERAAAALAASPALIGAAIGVLGAWLALLALHATAIAAHVMGGAWAAGVADGADDAPGACEWRLGRGAHAAIVLTAISAVWTTAMAHQLRAFLAAFVMACWYFTSADEQSLEAAVASALADPARSRARRAPVRTALALGVTTSFGSVCAAGAAEVVAVALRALARALHARAVRGRSVADACVACAAQALGSAAALLNRYSIAHVAVVGESYCASSRLVSALLARRALSAVVVDRLSAAVLHATALTVAAAAGTVTWLCAGGARASAAAVQPPPAHGASAAQLGWAVFALCALTLGFCVALVLNMIDAAFVCYALELDTGLDHRPALRNALVAVCSPPGARAPPPAHAAGSPSPAAAASASAVWWDGDERAAGSHAARGAGGASLGFPDLPGHTRDPPTTTAHYIGTWEQAPPLGQSPAPAPIGGGIVNVTQSHDQPRL